MVINIFRRQNKEMGKDLVTMYYISEGENMYCIYLCIQKYIHNNDNNTIS